MHCTVQFRGCFWKQINNSEYSLLFVAAVIHLRQSIRSEEDASDYRYKCTLQVAAGKEKPKRCLHYKTHKESQ